METRAIVRGVRLSAQKGRLVADQVRGDELDEAGPRPQPQVDARLRGAGEDDRRHEPRARDDPDLAALEHVQQVRGALDVVDRRRAEHHRARVGRERHAARQHGPDRLVVSTRTGTDGVVLDSPRVDLHAVDLTDPVLHPAALLFHTSLALEGVGPLLEVVEQLPLAVPAPAPRRKPGSSTRRSSVG